MEELSNITLMESTMISAQIVQTPIGPLLVTANERKITSIEFDGEQPMNSSSSELTQKCARQLQEYFDGNRKTFDLPLSQDGTEFQHQVWQQLTQIPFGITHSYSQIAQSIGRDKAVRAVGAANGRNKLPIVVPCHRVIGSDGSLTGFAGGMERKRWLLEHENSIE